MKAAGKNVQGKNSVLKAFGKKATKREEMASQEDEIDVVNRRNRGDNDDDDRKESNTIMQQINNFSLTPMNDVLAEQTIEDHKYLLELVENKCAIAFYACINRNQSLYNALKQYVLGHKEG
jgi:hypothetical protein